MYDCDPCIHLHSLSLTRHSYSEESIYLAVHPLMGPSLYECTYFPEVSAQPEMNNSYSPDITKRHGSSRISGLVKWIRIRSSNTGLYPLPSARMYIISRGFSPTRNALSSGHVPLFQLNSYLPDITKRHGFLACMTTTARQTLFVRVGEFSFNVELVMSAL